MYITTIDQRGCGNVELRNIKRMLRIMQNEMRQDVSLETPVGGWPTDYGVSPSAEHFNGGWNRSSKGELKIAMCIKLDVRI